MEAPELLSYASGGIAFTLLLLGLLRRNLAAPLTRLLITACVFTLAWCYIHVGPLPAFLPKNLSLITTEQIRNGAWILLLTQLLPPGKNKQALSYLCHAPWIATLLTIYYLEFKQASTGDLISYSAVLWLVLSTPIIALVLVEQTYRNTRTDAMEGMRFIYIAIGGLFSYDLYFYVHALLFDHINIEIEVTRGAITSIVALFIYVGLQRINNDRIQLLVSRKFVFYSTSLIAIGGFLFLMSMGGFYIRRYGGDWGTLAQSMFVFGASIFCLTLLSSKKTRAYLKVIISKHLLQHHYDYREEWLRLIHTLTSTTSGSDINQLSLKAMTQIFQTQGGALWTKHDNKVFIHSANIATEQLSKQELPADCPLQHYMESARRVIVLEEFAQFPERYPGLELPTWTQGKDLWIIVPLMLHNTMIGFILLKTPHMKRRLSWEDFDLLKTAGLQVASFLAAEQSSQTITESKQFDAYSRLTAFIMHDLKNLIAQQSLVVKNAAKHKDNPAFIEDAINTIDNSVKRMSRLLDQLKQGNESESESIFCLQNILVDAVRKCHNREPRPSLHMIEEELYVKLRSSNDQLSMILGHVIRNAQDATDNSGFIDVTLSQAANKAVIEVEDNGMGMSQDFIRERLFRPFDSTKSSKGMGIGAYQTREFIRQAGGDIEVSSEEGKGTTFCIFLPLAQDAKIAKTA